MSDLTTNNDFDWQSGPANHSLLQPYSGDDAVGLGKLQYSFAKHQTLPDPFALHPSPIPEVYDDYYYVLSSTQFTTTGSFGLSNQTLSPFLSWTNSNDGRMTPAPNSSSQRTPFSPVSDQQVNAGTEQLGNILEICPSSTEYAQKASLVDVQYSSPNLPRNISHQTLPISRNYCCTRQECRRSFSIEAELSYVSRPR
jgi:hypothetical protein